MHDYSVTFATLNCIEHTKLCVDSLISSGVDPARIVAVDNASTDGTQEYLQELGLGSVILNKQNLSCGAAWNQGILAQQSEWTIVMNNDILVAPDFAIRLIDFAKSHNLKIVSPARIDGDNDYNFHDFAIYAQNKMADALRLGSSNAVCMCIHWSVFNQIGFFRANPNLLGFEDGLFYNDVRKHDIKHATTGSVWIHHFGRVTQDHLKASLGLKEDDLLVKVNDRKLYDQSFFQRKLFRYRMKKSYKQWRSEELHKYKMTLQGISINNDLVWI